ncbi:MAG: tetratricopeptide repeat protein [Acidobacteria bacterium]|nr:MAG: tetratricopeptide repeat protein [Acidobacteriota bacterium]
MSKTVNFRALAIVLLAGMIPSLMAQEGDYQKGLSYYKQGQYQKTIEEFEKIIEVHPDYESGHRILGDSYLKIKAYDQAIEAFQKALELKGDNYVTHYGLALSFFNEGRYREAIAALNQGEDYARSPRDQYQIYRTRGSAYYNMNDFERAISDLQQAVSIQRGNASDVLQLGIAYYRLGNYLEAEKYLQQARVLDPQASGAKRYLSRLQFQGAIEAIEAKNYPQAVALLDEYVKEYPEDGEGRFNLGLAQLFAQNLDAAEREFLKCVELIPRNWEVYDRLGYLYESTKQYDKALQNYRTAHDLHQDPQVQKSVDRLQERIRRSQ